MELISIPYSNNKQIKDIFHKISMQPYSIWLDSGTSKSTKHYDIITSFPYKFLTSNLDKTEVKYLSYNKNLNIYTNSTNYLKTEIIIHENNINPFDILKQHLPENTDKTNLKSKYSPLVPFWHGAMGYFGYDLNQLIYSKLAKQKYKLDIPLMAIGIYAWAAIFNHKDEAAYIAYDSNKISKQTIYTISELLSSKDFTPHYLSNNSSNNTSSNLNNTNETTISRTSNLQNHYNNTNKTSNALLDTFFKNHKFTSNIDYNEYSSNFAKIKNHIKHGNCYQINYTIPFRIDSNNYFRQNNLSSWDIYNYIKTKNSNPFGCFFNISDNLAILSYSPERFIQINHGIATAMPIKGTRPNVPNNPEMNNKLMAELKSSIKDQAENIMITDLLRNDFNKHCVAGTVKTKMLCELQSFPTVHHLVSTIEGKLKPEISSIDLFRGCFPGGSITGAPKLRSMQIIQELENQNDFINRYIYCGSIGYINIDGTMDMSIAIRTAVYNYNSSNNTEELRYWAGGGIVADSECEAEYQEVFDKLIKTS